MNKHGVILMAVFRPDPGLLERQMRSLQEQTLPDWDCHVGIDGHDSQARGHVERLVGDDSRFRITEYERSVGHYRNFERVSRQASEAAPWVAYCDQDDYWYPEKLETLAASLDQQPNCYAVVGAGRVVDEAGTVLGVTERGADSMSQLVLKNEVTGSFSMFRRSVLDLALPFPDPTRAAVHDHWLGVCAAALGDVVFLRDVLQDYVQHGGNAIGEASPRGIRDTIDAIRSLGELTFRLDVVSREKWGWRVSMANALLARRDNVRDVGDPGPVAAVASGRLSAGLTKLLLVEAAAGRLPIGDAIGMAAAATWWPRVTDKESQALRAGRQTDR
jgi:glycosyltransferase involved in cell wall biosynthesis